MLVHDWNKCTNSGRSVERNRGFDESSLTEDVRTSLQLHARGWQSVYFPGPVADGFPPMDLRAYQKQLRRWAIGTFQNWKYAFFLLLIIGNH